MSARATLLLELGCEELPPRALQNLARAFADELARALAEAGVREADARYRYFATPRRLAAMLDEVAASQPRRTIERRGPAVRAAFDAAGKPTPAALGFAKSCGVKVTQLKRAGSGDDARLVFRSSVTGKKLAAVVTESLAQTLPRLPAPKRMRWGAGDFEFVRPAHWLLALHGKRALTVQALGLRAGRATRGHRFHANKNIALPDASAYEKCLQQQGMVIADFAKRRAKIETQLQAAARKNKARIAAPPGLLDLVTGMVEWPQVITAEFERRYLTLPPEALVAVMCDHQKYFPLANARGKLLPAFAAVCNIKSKSPAQVRRGNERVLRARLADAEFFLRNDFRVAPEEFCAQLQNILFHEKLGTLRDKTLRIEKLAAIIAEKIRADAAQSKRAAQLCKFDLAGDMVGEFPELQGVIGKYCAARHGESKTVCAAIEQHYWPRHAGDKLPRDAVAQSVALADRIDSLMGLFAAGEIPSGDKDPFGMRRAALAILRIVIEMQLDIDIGACMKSYRDALHAQPEIQPALTGAMRDETIDAIYAFMCERLKAYYQPLGYTADEIAAVQACRPPRPLDFDRRLRALSKFFTQRRAAAESLAAANKRIANILQKAESPPRDFRAGLLRAEAEIELAKQVEAAEAAAAKCFLQNRYDDGFAALCKLAQPVGKFFDEVMVMEKDAAIRANRLALLRRVRMVFLSAADISLMRAAR